MWPVFEMEISFFQGVIVIGDCNAHTGEKNDFKLYILLSCIFYIYYIYVLFGSSPPL